jgi:hypothetical protein
MAQKNRDRRAFERLEIAALSMMERVWRARSGYPNLTSAPSCGGDDGGDDATNDGDGGGGDDGASDGGDGRATFWPPWQA